MKVKKIKIGMQFYYSFYYQPKTLYTIINKRDLSWRAEGVFKEGLSIVTSNDYLLMDVEFLNPIEQDFNKWLLE